MADTNKIRYGIKNCYYAVATITSTGAATYSTPVAMPGAVSLSLDAQGETSPFYADNIVYYTSVSNSGSKYKPLCLIWALPGSKTMTPITHLSNGRFVLTAVCTSDSQTILTV